MLQRGKVFVYYVGLKNQYYPFMIGGFCYET